MDLGSLRKIDAGRMSTVGFYVDDAARGIENVGLTPLEAEALRLVVAFERKVGDREPTSAEQGYVRAASRMLDNAYDSDDGAHESAKYMAADLALQRHAGSVIAAAEAFGRDGIEPVGFEKSLVEYVIKQDLQDDQDVKADWKAMSEGRFEDASSMVHDLIEFSIRESEHLPEGAGSWMYDNERREEEPERDHRSGLVDVLDMMDDHPYEPSSRDFQEWIAGEPDAHLWEDDRYKAESERFYGRESVKEPGLMTREEILQARIEDSRAISLMPKNIVDEIERLGSEGVSFADKAIYAGGERLRIMVEMDNDPRAKDLAAALAHAVLSDRGASASEASAWMFEQKPALGVADMLAKIDREDGDQRHGLSRGTSERIAMSQAKDSVRSLTVDDRSVSGMVAACELAAEERGVPLKRLVAMVADERRRSDRTFAAHSDVVNDAVKEVLLEASIDRAVEMRSASRRDPIEERPFFSHPTSERLDEASRAVADLSDAIRMSDETIFVEPALRTAYATLDAAGIDMNGGAAVDRLESAWGRVLESRVEKGPLTKSQEARMVIYDVATQTEAAGLSIGNEKQLREAKTASILVSTMGIRNIREEQAGPMPLTPRELGMVTAGNFADLPRGSQAGLSLGVSYAKDSELLPLWEPMAVKSKGGLMGQAAGAASTGFSRVEAKASEVSAGQALASLLNSDRGR